MLSGFEAARFSVREKCRQILGQGNKIAACLNCDGTCLNCNGTCLNCDGPKKLF